LVVKVVVLPVGDEVEPVPVVVVVDDADPVVVDVVLLEPLAVGAVEAEELTVVVLEVDPVEVVDVAEDVLLLVDTIGAAQTPAGAGNNAKLNDHWNSQSVSSTSSIPYPVVASREHSGVQV
jgi:hypothetical protein